MSPRNLHIPRRVLDAFIASLPHQIGPGTYYRANDWTLTRTYDPQGDQHGVRLHRGESEVVALCRDNTDPRIDTNIKLAARFTPDDKPAAAFNPTLSLAMAMIDIDTEFESGELDTEFHEMVANARTVDDANRAKLPAKKGTKNARR